MNFTQRYGDALVVGTREPKDAKRNGGGRSMVDREKVINGLECCILRDPDDKMRCGECPYNESDTYCLNRLKMDALALFKAQEPKPPIITENAYGWKFYHCPSCGCEFYGDRLHGRMNKTAFCDKCGQAVKWDD